MFNEGIYITARDIMSHLFWAFSWKDYFDTFLLKLRSVAHETLSVPYFSVFFSFFILFCVCGVGEGGVVSRLFQ